MCETLQFETNCIIIIPVRSGHNIIIRIAKSIFNIIRIAIIVMNWTASTLDYSYYVLSQHHTRHNWTPDIAGWSHGHLTFTRWKRQLCYRGTAPSPISPPWWPWLAVLSRTVSFEHVSSLKVTTPSCIPHCFTNLTYSMATEPLPTKGIRKLIRSQIQCITTHGRTVSVTEASDGGRRRVLLSGWLCS